MMMMMMIQIISSSSSMIFIIQINLNLLPIPIETRMNVYKIKLYIFYNETLVHRKRIPTRIHANHRITEFTQRMTLTLNEIVTNTLSFAINVTQIHRQFDSSCFQHLYSIRLMQTLDFEYPDGWTDRLTKINF